MGVATLAITDATVSGLRQLATSQGTTADALAEQAIRSFLRQEAEAKIDREEQLFRAQHAQLLLRYTGQFVAMHEGRVIDSDPDELALYLRVRQRFPMIGVLIKQVTTETEEVWMIRSPHLEIG